ncbi:FAD-dependent oxidoreductase [Massilia niastensis]|uniref:FAD-dependent oxidoreductase n=1 Tax=Massilia niastensis TaxID=544911 RepID=UPI0003687D95|nr:FAD-dependent oxidoreductase [Massilia niastensis]
MLGSTNGSSTSVWMDTASVPAFPPLQGDVEAQVCVIGAGIAGLTTAYLLSKEGRTVVLIDALGIGAGETGRTTAHMFPPDEWYAFIDERFGATHARLVADSYARAIDRVESIVREEGIGCEFERLDGYLYALPGNAFRDFDKEHASAVRAGVPAQLLPRVPGLAFDTGPCVRYPNQAQFHPLKYLDGLARAFVKNGGRIHGGTHAHRIRGDHQRQTVFTDSGQVHAGAVVVATHTPFNDRVVMHTKQAGYRTYVVGLRVPRGSVPRILLWDTGQPYYYVRLETPDGARDHDILIVGGADHKVGQDDHPEHRYDEIERWTRERFPMAQELAYRWSGEVMEPSDGPAYLGRNPMDDDNVYVITGDSGNGMTHCTIGAVLVTDLVMGRSNPWTALYDPSRKPVHGLADFAAEQANVMARYGDWLTGGDVDSVQEIAAGEGAVVRDGLRRIAVYRDPEGALHAVSAKCSHLGCAVHWNSAERSWDCPCHGSRFDTEGHVLHGPASLALDKVELSAEGLPPPRTQRGARRPVR